MHLEFAGGPHLLRAAPLGALLEGDRVPRKVVAQFVNGFLFWGRGVAPEQDVAALVAFGTWEEFFVKEQEYLLVLHEVFDHGLLVLGCEASRVLQFVKALAFALGHVMPDRRHAV